MPRFSQKSLDILATCDKSLQELFNEVIKHIDCSIICGHRGQAEQDDAFSKNRSKVKFPFSKHNSLPSLAVDVYPYPYDWKVGNCRLMDLIAEGDILKINRYLNNVKKFYFLAGFVKRVAWDLGIKIRWGGDWDSDNDLTDQSFDDLPHWEILK